MKKSVGAKTLPLPAPVWVVGTYDAAGRANVMTASWVGICCSKPPCVSVSLRKATYSYGNIVARQAFTICVPSEQYIKTTDYWGIASGRDVDKFAKVGLNAVASDLVDAPYVEEFPVVMECKVIHTIEIGSHTQFIGEILDIKIEEAILGPAGSPDVEKLRLFVLLDGYRGIGEYLGEAFSIGLYPFQTMIE
jgi:flavin reductase (DIM6/NTAB) family NADH-FMN oxidoreductase RutF